MTKGDQAIQSAADRLERLVSGARRSGGVKSKVADRFATQDKAPRAVAPSGPQLERPMSRRRSSGVSPWLVIGAAFAGGYLAAKVIDWRSHAHPR